MQNPFIDLEITFNIFSLSSSFKSNGKINIEKVLIMFKMEINSKIILLIFLWLNAYLFKFLKLTRWEMLYLLWSFNEFYTLFLCSVFEKLFLLMFGLELEKQFVTRLSSSVISHSLAWFIKEYLFPL